MLFPIYTFVGDKELFSFIGEHVHLLTGCCECNTIWPNKEKLQKIESVEFFQKLGSAIFSLNHKQFSTKQLQVLEMPIVFSKICPQCFSRSATVKEIRENQRSEGNFDCFCSGSLYCDQFHCTHKSACIRDENISPAKEEYFSHLLGKIQGNFFPEQVCA
jgi:hypothetical protein